MKQNEAAAAAMCCQNCDSADLTRRGTDIFSLRCHLSISDIFREFNAMIEGYSTGTGSVNDLNAFLNQAVPGAEAEYVAFCFTFAGDGCFIYFPFNCLKC